MKPRDVIASKVCFGEAPTGELAKTRDSLSAEIKILQVQRADLVKDVGLPMAIKSLKRSAALLIGKKNKIESEISTMIVNKATIIRDGVEEETREARCLKEEVETALTSLKSGLFSYEDKLKVKIGEVDAIDKRAEKANGLLSATVATIKRKRLESLEELSSGLAKVDEARSKFEQEKLEFKKRQEEVRADIERSERMVDSLDTREKLLNELEATSNVANKKYATEKEANEKRFSEVQESQRLTQEKLSQAEIKMKAEEVTMVQFKKSLLLREEKVIKREKDLDNNWTVFLNSGGKESDEVSSQR